MAHVELKTLKGPALHWAVAKAAGIEVEVRNGALYRFAEGDEYAPTSNWNQLGELIKTREIVLSNHISEDGAWGGAHSFSSGTNFDTYDGIETAACRSIVAAGLIEAGVFGATSVDVPIEVLALPETA